jgi:heat shock protein HslJ
MDAHHFKGRTALLMVAFVALPVTMIGLLTSAGCGGSDALRGGPLTETVWVLSSYSSGDGMIPVDASVRSDILFGPESVAGNGGVNSFSGPYEATNDGKLTVGDLASTAMAGPEGATEVETAVFAGLADVAEYYADDSTLTLYDDGGSELLAYAKDTATVTGEWLVTGYNNGKEAVVSTIIGTDLTATFGEDGTLSGFAGVNTYNGTYTTSGETITIGPLATTRMAGPDDLMEQETLYLAALAAATVYRLSGDNLELRDDAGALQVSFARAAQ